MITNDVVLSLCASCFAHFGQRSIATTLGPIDRTQQPELIHHSWIRQLENSRFEALGNQICDIWVTQSSDRLGSSENDQK